MAQPTTISANFAFLYIGDGAGSETFTKICGLTDVQFTTDKSTNEFAVPDCDDPTVVPPVVRNVVSTSASFTASGAFTKESWPKIRDAAAVVTSRNFRLHLVGAGSGGATPDLRISGKFHIKFNLSATYGDLVQVEISGDSDGAIAYTDVAAL